MAEMPNAYDGRDLEAVYDEQISPLMARIIAVCKEHGMPMVASFHLRTTPTEGKCLCTTAILPTGSAPELRAAYREIRRDQYSVCAITVTHNGAGGQ